MATLEKIRNKAALLIIVVGLAMLAFIMGDFLRSGTTFFSQEQNVALKIDGEKIKAPDFQERLNQVEQLQGGGQSLSDEQRMYINNQVAQQFENEVLVNKEAEALGVDVSSAEFLAMLTGQGGIAPSPMLSQFLGQFGINAADSKAVSDFINQMTDKSISSQPQEVQSSYKKIQLQWLTLQQQSVLSRKQEKIASLLSRSVVLNDIDAQFMSEVPNRQVAMVHGSSAGIADDKVKVTDQDIQKYYDSHKEYFKLRFGTTKMQYISKEVRPSAKDYADAEKTMQNVKSLLATKTPEDAFRNISDKFIASTYLTMDEISQMNLPGSVTDFITSAAVNEVNDPTLANDQYSLVKLTGKKNATAGVKLQMIVLDSTKLNLVDSINTQLSSGVNFGDLARKYSVDDRSKASDGYVLMANRFGMPDSTITEAIAASSQMDTIFKVPFGNVITIKKNNYAMLLKASDPKPAVDKYKFAYGIVPATFSDDTYNSDFNAMSQILLNNSDFKAMAKAAADKGYQVEDGIYVDVSTPILGNIASSRPVIHWALNADAGAISEKVQRCGLNNIMIASVVEHVKPGYKPLSMVKGDIKRRLMDTKKGEKMASDLEAKKLTTLEDYASAMQSRVDTISGMSYTVTGAQPALVNGYAMTTALQSISKPFSTEDGSVYVVRPMSESNAPAGASVQAVIQQKKAAMSNQIAQRAFMHLYNILKIKDNRAKFY